MGKIQVKRNFFWLADEMYAMLFAMLHVFNALILNPLLFPDSPKATRSPLI